MASFVFTGTATDWSDLLDKVRGHLTDGGTLGSQVWTELDFDTSDPDERISYLQGPGLAGADEIHVNIREYSDEGEDIYNWEIRGATAYDGGVGFNAQPGTSPGTHLPLWDSSIPYWLVVNGRRFVLVAKVSTVYSTLYAGFILPYASTAEMPYPLYIAATTSTAYRWSDGTYRIGSFWDPTYQSAYLRHYDGAWVTIYNFSNGTGNSRSQSTANVVWPWEKDYLIGQNADNSYGLLAGVIHSEYGDGNVYGELDGVFFISGFSLGAEDIAEIGADDYLVVQSVYRTGRRDYAAIKLG